MTLPMILVIDDQFGKSIKDRRNLCKNFALRDVTGNDRTPHDIMAPLAEAIFCSAQREENDSIINDLHAAVSAVKQGWPNGNGQFWSMVLLDIRFVSGKIGMNDEPKGQAGDDDFGMRVVEEIHKNYPDIPVVMLSSRERKEVLKECMEKGAADFIQRVAYSDTTTSPREVLGQKLFEHALLPDTREPGNGKRIVGNSLSILKTLRSARRAATGKGNVLLLGETGTGKELLARYIHDMSPKSKGPYVVFDASHTAETLHEDALFGHVKGIFTDAKTDKPGLFETADGGTLFLDEIGDISDDLQVKLRRPLQERIVKRQGGRDKNIDIQVVLATNRDLDEDAKAGRFRRDLLNRIGGFPITLAPLNERREDISLIAPILLEGLCQKHGARGRRTITQEAMDSLVSHDWSESNVRGLEKMLEQVVQDKKDVEIVVPRDLVFWPTGGHVEAAGVAGETARALAAVPATEIPAGDIDALIKSISDFELPEDYAKLQGRLPKLQKAVARMLAKYLVSTIEATKKMKPGATSDGEVNLTGAVSCMMGTQLKTPKAADIIKKLFKTDKNALKDILEDNPSLKELYHEVLRLRPSKPNNTSSKQVKL